MDLGLGDPGALDAHRLARAHRQEEGVTLTDELLGAGLVEDDAGVGERGGGEGHAARHVGLDEAGDDVDGGPLGREHEVDAGGAGELGDPDDRFLDIAGGDHHEVGELVDDDEEIGVRLQHALRAGQRCDPAALDGAVEVVDVLEPEGGEVVVPRVHLLDDPLEGLGGLLGVGDDRRDEVRDAVVGGELDALGVDEDHPDLIGRGAHEDRGDHRVDEARLTRAGRAGDEQVGHLREVGDDVAALDVLADAHDHRVGVLVCDLAAQDVAEADLLAVGVGDLDADRGLAGDRREDPHVGARDGVRDVLRERRDALDLDAGAELDLVAGDGRAAREAGDLGVDRELVEDAGEGLHDAVVDDRARLVRGPRLEDRLIGQRVGDVAGERELLDALGQRLGRGRLEVGLGTDARGIDRGLTGAGAPEGARCCGGTVHRDGRSRLLRVRLLRT